MWVDGDVESMEVCCSYLSCPSCQATSQHFSLQKASATHVNVILLSIYVSSTTLAGNMDFQKAIIQGIRSIFGGTATVG